MIQNNNNNNQMLVQKKDKFQSQQPLTDMLDMHLNDFHIIAGHIDEKSLHQSAKHYNIVL
jgi:hypothetical protein